MPTNIRREFFQIDETFLVTPTNQLVDSNIVRKVGKNDAYVYQNEVKFLFEGEKIQKKK